MNKIEIRINRQRSLLNIVFVSAVILASGYFLFATDQFSMVTKIAGATGSGILVVFVLRPLIANLSDDKPHVTMDVDKISFREDEKWTEIKRDEIKNVALAKYYDRYKIRKVIRIETIDGSQWEVILNGLDYDWNELREEIEKQRGSP